MTDLQASLLSVGEVFADAGVNYEIPIYQRNYAWRMEHIEQLIDDVSAASQTGAESYFLGNLIVAERTPHTGSSHQTYEVVDGQQRLTTLFMLLRQLRIDSSSRLTYESRRAATDALAGLTDTEVDEGAGIQAGFKAIESRMAWMTDAAERESFIGFLRERVHLVRAVLPAHTDLNRYFEVMNTRGQQLTQVDIVKARLMSYLHGDDTELLRGCFAWVWDACSTMDSYIQLTLTPSKPTLRAEIFGDTWDRLRPLSFAQILDVWRAQHGSTSRETNAYEPVSLDDALEHYARATPQADSEETESTRFESPIGFGDLLLHALKTLDRDDGGAADDGQLDDSKLITLFEDSFQRLSDDAKSARAMRFLMELLRVRFVLDNFVLKREYTARNGEDGAWSLKRLVRGTPSGRSTPSPRYVNSFMLDGVESDGEPTDHLTRGVLLLQSMLRVTYTSPRTMHWLTGVLRQELGDVSPWDAADRIEEQLRTYARERVRQAFFSRGEPTGFAVERIVFTYLDYLLVTRALPGYQPDRDFSFRYRNSIEHFFPQCPDREQQGWDVVDLSSEELQLLGNLALISVGSNSKFSNNLPKQKASFQEMVKQSPKLDLMAQEALLGEWNAATIRRHHKAMRQLLLTDLGLR